MTARPANLEPICGEQQTSAEDRRAGRFSTTDLTCSIGKVINLCRDGMRVQARSVPTGVFAIAITDRNTTVHVNAEVVWTKRAGLFKKELGIRFINVPSDVVSKLALIAQARSRQASV